MFWLLKCLFIWCVDVYGRVSVFKRERESTYAHTHTLVFTTRVKENIFQNHSISYHPPGKHESGVQNLINECIFISGCAARTCAVCRLTKSLPDTYAYIGMDWHTHATCMKGNSCKRINNAAPVCVCVCVYDTHFTKNLNHPLHTLCTPGPNKQFYYNFIHRF